MGLKLHLLVDTCSRALASQAGRRGLADSHCCSSVGV
jgi:hypothetical protein